MHKKYINYNLLVKLIKKEFIRILKKKSFYIICIILTLNILEQIFNVNIGVKPIRNSIAMITNSYEVIILFSLFIIFNSRKDKKKLNIEIQSNKLEWFLSKIISMFIIILLVESIFITVKIFINSIGVGFEFLDIKNVLLGIIFKVMFILAVVSILFTIMLIIENNILAVGILLLIIKCETITSILGKVIGISINFREISMTNYLNEIYMERLDGFGIFIGIIVYSTYIFVFIIIGMFFLGNYNSRVNRIKLIGHKHELLANIKFLIEIATYVHNKIFLEYKDNEREKEIVLDELKQIVKLLVEQLEKYKNKEIKISELNKKYCICINMYREINKEYPWVATFGLYEGYGFNYYKHFKSML